MYSVRAVLRLPQILPQSSHKRPRPCARGRALLPAWRFRLGFSSPQFLPAKSQGENAKLPRAARKVGVAFTPAPIRRVRGC